MPVSYFACAAVLLVADVLARPWSAWKRRGGYYAAYLLMPYLPLFVAPFLPDRWIALAFGAVALGALVSFSNMVGLTGYPRAFVPTAMVTVAFFVAALVHWYGLFQAMPVFALSVLLAVFAPGARPQGFLQRLCLSWVSCLVYGYLWAHSLLFLDTDLRGLADGKSWDLLALLCAKAGDTVWALVRDRLGRRTRLLQALSTVPGSMAGGVVASWLYLPGGAQRWEMVLFGAVVGAGLVVGSWGHEMIATDVLEREQRAPLKSTMLFAFGFSLALGYHLIRYLAFQTT